MPSMTAGVTSVPPSAHDVALHQHVGPGAETRAISVQKMPPEPGA